MIILKVRSKGVLILPKKIGEKAGLKEGDEVIVEVKGDSIVLRPLRPKVVDVDPGLIDELLKEERELEAGKYDGSSGATRFVPDTGVLIST